MKKFFYGIAATLTILILMGATGIVTGGWRMDDKLNCMWATVTGSPSACLMNARGVTDGSSAAPGMVGEFVSAVAGGSTYGTTTAANTWTDASAMGTITLTAGSWELGYSITGVAYFNVSSDIYCGYRIYNVTDASAIVNSLTFYDNYHTGGMFPISTNAGVINIASTKVYRMEVKSNGSGGGTNFCAIYGSDFTSTFTNPDSTSILWARRIR